MFIQKLDNVLYRSYTRNNLTDQYNIKAKEASLGIPDEENK